MKRAREEKARGELKRKKGGREGGREMGRKGRAERRRMRGGMHNPIADNTSV